MAIITNVSATPVQVSAAGALLDVGGTAPDLDPADEHVARGIARGALVVLDPPTPEPAAPAKPAKETR